MRFDWIFYVGHHPDLIPVGIDTEEKAREHWESFGKSEGRFYNPSQIPFNWHLYLGLNEDITNVHTPEDALRHWLKYGKKENRRIWPPCKIVTIVAAHLNTPLKVDAFINNIPYLNEISSKVIVVSSELPDLKYRTSELTDIIDTVDYIVVPNDPVLTCYSKYLTAITPTLISEFDRFILTNDSYYMCRSLKQFKDYCHMDKECITFLASNQVHYHFTDFLRCYNTSGLRKIKKLYTDSTTIKSVKESIDTFELHSLDIFSSVLPYMHAIPHLSTNIFFDTIHLYDSILNRGMELIKLKSITRKNHSYTSIPADFDVETYKYINTDLSHFTNEEATEHFLLYGIIEGRTYTNDPPVINPEIRKLFGMLQIAVPSSLSDRAMTATSQ